jgi:hypothetical protein
MDNKTALAMAWLGIIYFGGISLYGVVSGDTAMAFGAALPIVLLARIIWRSRAGKDR